ncbi:unnamed protein product [Vitrella brassicaformis CCMP3155]|uniref:Uncharacterized protein n=1 Tax=Vitrella brassicaformis (strain CCMP3155) TaxID=1169540 RepID=A0A0G4F0V9_VITBC|nr:unnamed protein product [Vitrella brassicaformis CCMP3155]|eukprot:CEM05506.1 unnamed protein product [Vitrella brassicaformis CCMP3155]
MRRTMPIAPCRQCRWEQRHAAKDAAEEASATAQDSLASLAHDELVPEKAAARQLHGPPQQLHPLAGMCAAWIHGSPRTHEIETSDSEALDLRDEFDLDEETLKEA